MTDYYGLIGAAWQRARDPLFRAALRRRAVNTFIQTLAGVSLVSVLPAALTADAVRAVLPVVGSVLAGAAAAAGLSVLRSLWQGLPEVDQAYALAAPARGRHAADK